MAIFCCIIHGFGRATFGSVLVKPLNHLQMATTSCHVHGFLGAAFSPVFVEPLDHLQMAILGR
jgi:hypothetical protein